MKDSQTVQNALQEFYQTHYFGDEALTAKVVQVRLGPLRFLFPNPKQRRDAIHLHDLTHLLTGYDTSWTGEGEVAAWELASGFPRKYWIGWVYAPMTFTVGFLISPLKVAKAFVRGWGQTNLYKLDLPREKLNSLTLLDLKEELKRAAARRMERP
jgi:hypothetical protein